MYCVCACVCGCVCVASCGAQPRALPCVYIVAHVVLCVCVCVFAEPNIQRRLILIGLHLLSLYMVISERSSKWMDGVCVVLREVVTCSVVCLWVTGVAAVAQEW